MTTSQSYSRLQLTDTQDLTIPQTAALIVRGGSVLQKGAILGDTDTLIPGGIRFRSNQLQVRSMEEWTTHLGLDSTYDPSRVNEIVMVAKDGQALQLSGVRIFDRGLYDLENVQTSHVESKPSERLSFGSKGYLWRWPEQQGGPRQVLTTNGRGDLYWSNNASTNEVTFTGEWKKDRLIQCSSEKGMVNITPLELTSKGDLSGLTTLRIRDFSIQTSSNIVHLATLSSNLSLLSPQHLYLQGSIWPKEVPRPFSILRCSSQVGQLEYADLFVPSSWETLSVPRQAQSTGQLQATAVKIKGEKEKTTLVTPILHAQEITDGTLTITEGKLETSKTVQATSLSDGYITINAGSILGLQHLQLAGSLKTNTLSVQGNMTGANIRASGLLSGSSVRVGNEQKSLHLLGGSVPKKSTSPGQAGDMTWDENYIYLHVGARWKRLPLEDF